MLKTNLYIEGIQNIYVRNKLVGSNIISLKIEKNTKKIHFIGIDKMSTTMYRDK